MTRKVFLILLALVLALSVGMVGCDAQPSGEQEEEEEEESPNGEQEEEEEVDWDLCIDFEDLTVEAEYNVGDTISSCGVTLRVEEFQLSPPPHDEYAAGYAMVQDREDAGGSGQEIWINNVNLYLRRTPGNLLEGLSLLFGEYGGNINVQVNDEFVNVDDFWNLPASMGGVDVTVSDFGDGKGRLTLSKGQIGSFKIGGQELVIDDICLADAS